jgi:small subunit ribosomal protein S4
MGDPKFNRKTYETPRHPWEGERIREERELMRRYGLKNKREVWKAKSILGKYRAQARVLQARLRYGHKQSEIELKQMMDRLVRYGILDESNTNLDAVLSLTVEDILKRRLQTIVYLKGLARTPKQARQFIVHGHIAIGERRVTVPSYLVKVEEEPLIRYCEYSPLANEAHPMRPDVVERPEAEVREGDN